MEETIQLGGIGSLIWLIVVLLGFLLAAAAVALIVVMGVTPEVRKWGKDPNRSLKGLMVRLVLWGVAVPFWLALLGIGFYSWLLWGKVHKAHISDQGDIVCTNALGLPVHRIDGADTRTANWLVVTSSYWDDYYQKYRDQDIFHFILRPEGGETLKLTGSSGESLRDSLGYTDKSFLSKCTNRQASGGGEVMTLPHTFNKMGPVCGGPETK